MEETQLRSSGPARHNMTMEDWWAWVDRLTRSSGILGLYGQFIEPGNLVFDVGACNGTRTEIFRLLGAKVIAIEPLAAWGDEFVPELFWKFKDDPLVTIVPIALSDEGGRMEFCIQKYIPCMSSLNHTWMKETIHRGYYNESALIHRETDCTTLAACCQWYGQPDFIKIDVEGHENAVARGLTWAPPAFNLEYHVDWIPLVALRHFDHIADHQGYRYEYNYTLNTTAHLQMPEWVSSHELALWLATHLTPEGNGSWGDIYGRRVKK